MRTILIALLCVGAACSPSDGGSRFSTQDAESLAKRFHDALTSGDVAALARMSRTPFRYKDVDRVWADATTLQANLAKEVPRIRHLTVGLDRIEVLSIEDLRAGRWPRARAVDEAAREGEIAKLGVERDGWIARVHSEGKAGYMLVLNREGRELAVQMLDI